MTQDRIHTQRNRLSTWYRAILLALSLTLVGLGAIFIPASAQPAALLVTATNVPQHTLGSDGMEHLEYDLILTNFFPSPVELQSLEVLAPDGRVLLRLEGDALAAVTSTVFAGEPTTEMPVSGAVATILDVVVPRGHVPVRVSHRIVYSLPDDVPLRTLVGRTVIEGPELIVDPRLALR